ncbi:MAG TPA: MFS transporter [Chloroflexia bacterium]|nr:MFS transporter [Chloroflexia bacterium]
MKSAKTSNSISPDVISASESANLSQESKIQNPKSKIQNRPGLHITIAALGIFLAALDQTVIVTALSPIATDMEIDVKELDKAAWVVTAYLLGYTVALPLMGRVADVYGQRRIYLISLGIFMAGSVLCAIAPDLMWLVIARSIQAVGGGAVLPVGMAMARHIFPERRVPFMLGILGAVAEAGAVIGPLWGALVMKGFDGTLNVSGWRWIFWVNIPLGLLFAGLILLTPTLPRFPGKIDWLGAGLFAGALLALVLGLSTPGSAGAWLGLDLNQADNSTFFTPQGIGLLLLAAILFVVFWLWQRRAKEPLLPPDLFSRRKWPFAAANLTNLLVGAALIVTMVNIPLYVASVLEGSVEQGGLMLLRMTAFIPVGAVLGGVLGARVTYRWIAIAGLLITAAGFWQMAGWTTTSADDPLTWLGLALNGLGFGLLISPVTTTALQWGGLERAALSAASVNLSRMVGMMVSLSILAVLGLRHFKDLMASPARPPADDMTRLGEYIQSASLEVYTGGFMIAGVICLIAVAFAAWLRRNPHTDVEAGPIF